MKKYILPLLIMAALSAAVSCNDALQDEVESLRNRVSDIEAQLTKINTNLSTLSELVSALQNNDHIKYIKPWAGDNYVISFTSGTNLFLYQGKSGVTPIVGVKYYDAQETYYWTIQMGPNAKVQWMTGSNGQRVRATGIVPQMKIEDGVWMYSFDGKNWIRCPWGSSEGTSGNAVFKSIDTSDPYYVTFTLANGTVFQIPTQKGYDELTKMCQEINDQFDTYTTLVNNLDGSMFIKSVAEMQENGETVGYIITLEDGSVLQIRNGENCDFTTQISARQDKDGKYYWVYRTDPKQDYQWLIYQGAKVPVTPEDMTPTIGITEIDGTLYFTISYSGGDPELMRDSEGNPVQATGRAGFSFIESAEIETGQITLTLADGSVVTIATTRLFTPSLALSQTITDVACDTYYDACLKARIVDTLQMMATMPNFDVYCAETGTSVTAVAVDGGYAATPVVASFTSKSISTGTEYTIVLNLPFRTALDWDTAHKTRIAVFLNWGSNSIMRVATFNNI